MPEEKELELRDYLEVILKRKWLIILGAGLVLLVTFLVSLASPKKYEARAVFQNAYFETESAGTPAENYLMTAPEVLALIKNPVLLEPLFRKLKMEPAEIVQNLEIENLKDSTLFQARLKGTDAAQIKETLAGFLELLSDYGQFVFDKKTNYFKRSIKKLGTEIETTGLLVKKLETQLISSNDKSADSLVKTIVLKDLYQAQKCHLEELKIQKEQLEMQINSFKNFQIISGPSVSTPAAAKKIIKNLLLAGILGILFFTYLAFFLEYWEKSSKKT